MSVTAGIKQSPRPPTTQHPICKLGQQAADGIPNMSAPSPETVAAAAAPQGRLNRACQHCRRRKIKCIIDPQEVDHDLDRCTRCLKLGLDCAFVAPTVKRTRRRNEARIRVLERRLQEIQETVAAGKATTDDGSPSTTSGAEIAALSFSEASGDPLDSGLVSDCLAEELYCAFHSSLAPLYPLVSPPDQSAWQIVRRDRPALFRAVLTAASNTVDPVLSSKLFQGTGAYLAEKAVLAGEKSLDLLQGLLILAIWHHPAKRFQELRFSQYANMAATIVMDLHASNESCYSVSVPEGLSAPTGQLVETCRTFLASYFLCSRYGLPHT